MALLSKFKSYLWGGIAALIGLLLVAVKFLSAKNSRLERQVDTAHANIKRRQIISEADIEIEKTERKIRERIQNDSNPVPDDPDDWVWDDGDDSR